jgi:hypothetical protein
VAEGGTVTGGQPRIGAHQRGQLVHALRHLAGRNERRQAGGPQRFVRAVPAEPAARGGVEQARRVAVAAATPLRGGPAVLERALRAVAARA